MIGDVLPMAPCGAFPHCSFCVNFTIFSLASARLRKPVGIQHSARKRPLNASMKVLSLVERGALVRPQIACVIQTQCVVDPDRRRKSYRSADVLQHLHDIGAAPLDFITAWQIDRSRIHRVLQRQVPRRIFERALVHELDGHTAQSATKAQSSWSIDQWRTARPERHRPKSQPGVQRWGAAHRQQRPDSNSEGATSVSYFWQWTTGIAHGQAPAHGHEPLQQEQPIAPARPLLLLTGCGSESSCTSSRPTRGISPKCSPVASGAATARAWVEGFRIFALASPLADAAWPLERAQARPLRGPGHSPPTRGRGASLENVQS
jgi:hypothetical protein